MLNRNNGCNYRAIVQRNENIGVIIGSKQVNSDKRTKVLFDVGIFSPFVVIQSIIHLFQCFFFDQFVLSLLCICSIKWWLMCVGFPDKIC